MAKGATISNLKNGSARIGVWDAHGRFTMNAWIGNTPQCDHAYDIFNLFKNYIIRNLVEFN